jgi:hypothetical protein
VSIARLILVNFDEEINSSTINTQTFKLMLNGNVIPGDIEYKDRVATLTPASTLLNGRAYSVILTTGIKDLAGNALTSDYSWNFTTVTAGAGGGGAGGSGGGSSGGTTPDTTVPTIGATTIPSNSANAAINKGISVTFSEPMDSSTINSQTFIVNKEVISSSASIPDSLLNVRSSSRALIVVNGTVSYANQTATFTPVNNFDYNSTYFVTLTTGIKDLAGNPLAGNYTLNFTTLKPTLQPQTPRFEGREGNDILVYSWIAAPRGCLALQSVSSVPAKESDWKNTLYEVSYNNGVNKVSINTSVIGIQFFRLAQVSAPCDISVPRIVSTNPANDALDVPIDIILSVVFDEDMDASSVMNHFVLKKEGVIIAGTANYANKVISFKPNLNLSLNTTYTAMIASDAKDISGNGLAGNYTWNFRTVKN